ncbi:coproporphyrinogen III oxidase [Bacillus testis]|uniref:coproporphyrinogen III oxidase n=1 Tax=Bacillus testis TaxID=1622072 RepID=UPI00067E82A4|nr:coproporphyrinogen III oxidase [Bacillus testis]
MLIEIKGLQDERFLRPLRLIANLFFENTKVTFAKGKGPQLIASFTVKYSNGILVDVELTDQSSSRIYKGSCRKEDIEGTDKERFTQLKNTVSYAYLDALQQLTGIHQKWGFLTGIRPTKLLHKSLREGATKEEAHRFLHDQYSITDEKIDLMQEIVDRQLQVVPDLYDLRNEVSIYIGIPFCPTKCAYCTFPAYAIAAQRSSVPIFLEGLHYEIEKIGQVLKELKVPITTIYYGGGTPTSVSAKDMDMMYEQMYKHFPDVKNVREITVEAGRPDTITPEKLEVLNKWNIDRISINPQSYSDETLKAIGRHHSVAETIDKFHMAREMGMNNINMDLIIGLPGEGTKEFQHSLDETEKLMPESLTVHTLSFKRASEMTQNKDKYQVADRYEVERMMNLAESWTREHGYVPYYLYRQQNILGNLENVGYSFPGQESIYNIMIMEEQQTIIGIGCGAASKFIDRHTGAIQHFANPKDPKSYNDSYKKYTEDKIQILKQLFAD